MVERENGQGKLEPEIEDFLSLLASIAARVLTRHRPERENGPTESSEDENESSGIRESQFRVTN
jgi:hypothetical protein